MDARFAAFLPGILLVAGYAGTAAAQNVLPETSEREIVVPGDRPVDSEEVKRQARQITADRNLRNQPLARFEEPICPGVIGLPLDLAGPIVVRVRAVANAIGIDTADESDCRPNIIIAFTGDGKADLKEIAKRDSSLLSGMSYWERKKLLKDEGPVWAFSLVATKSNSGIPAGIKSPVFETTISSRLVLSVRRDIAVAVVLFNADAADGKTVTQLADYAAMRTFARTRPPKGDVYYGTILQLFEELEPLPEQLTTFDVAYLTAVYEGAPNRKGMTKLKRVARTMPEGAEDNQED